jgi:hypothetical protein
MVFRASCPSRHTAAQRHAPSPGAVIYEVTEDCSRPQKATEETKDNEALKDSRALDTAPPFPLRILECSFSETVRF